jgi:hypothetical protein
VLWVGQCTRLLSSICCKLFLACGKEDCCSSTACNMVYNGLHGCCMAPHKLRHTVTFWMLHEGNIARLGSQ